MSKEPPGIIATLRGRFPGATVARIVLGAIMIAIVITLLAGPKPWDLKKLDTIKDYVRAYEWWAALINLIPLGLLALSAPRWLAPLAANPETPRLVRPRGFSAIVAAAMIVSAVTGALRLDDSLWGDEAFSVRQSILGSYRVKDDKAVLKAVPWTNTFWYYTKPTNHILQSILSRLSLSAWRTVARPGGLQINEPAVRFPGYVAGVFSVGVLALLLARAGMPWTGAVAAWVMALHPWHLRLIAEARGYGMVILFVPLCCLMALHALENGRWRWWVALALAELAMIYTWPPSALIALILNAGILIMLLAGSRPALGTLLLRWLVTQIMAAMVFFQLFLPCAPQVMPYLDTAFGFFSHSFWQRNVGSLFLTGSLWTKSDLLDTPYMEYMPYATAHPVLFKLALILALVFLVLGCIRLCVTNASSRLLAAVFILPGPILYAVAALRDKYLYEWYMSFMLPGIVALVAAGAMGLMLPWRKNAGIRWIGPAWAVVFLGGFFVLSHPARHFLLTRSAHYCREAVLLTRPSLDSNSAENARILTATTTQAPDTYDPRVRRIESLEGYAAIMQEADDRQWPLYVNNGYPGALHLKHPAIAAMLEDPAVFELVKTLTGTEEMLDRVVYKYRPGGLAHANFALYKQMQSPARPHPSEAYSY